MFQLDDSGVTLSRDGIERVGERGVLGQVYAVALVEELDVLPDGVRRSFTASVADVAEEAGHAVTLPAGADSGGLQLHC